MKEKNVLALLPLLGAIALSWLLILLFVFLYR
jgi:hypothetical protein